MKKRRVILEELVSYDVLLKDLERIMSKSSNKQPDETQCTAIELYMIEETAKIFKVSQRTLFNWGKTNCSLQFPLEEGFITERKR